MKHKRQGSLRRSLQLSPFSKPLKKYLYDRGSSFSKVSVDLQEERVHNLEIASATPTPMDQSLDGAVPSEVSIIPVVPKQGIEYEISQATSVKRSTVCAVLYYQNPNTEHTQASRNREKSPVNSRKLLQNVNCGQEVGRSSQESVRSAFIQTVMASSIHSSSFLAIFRTKSAESTQSERASIRRSKGDSLDSLRGKGDAPPACMVKKANEWTTDSEDGTAHPDTGGSIMMQREETTKSRITLSLPSIALLKLPLNTKRDRSVSTGAKPSTCVPNAVRFADSEEAASFDASPNKVAIDNVSRSSSWTPENSTESSRVQPRSLDLDQGRPILSRRFTTKSTKAISRFILGGGIKLKSTTDLIDKLQGHVGSKIDRKGCRKNVKREYDNLRTGVEEALSTRVGRECEPSSTGSALQSSDNPHYNQAPSSGTLSSSIFPFPSFSIPNRLTLTIPVDLPLTQLFVAGILQLILASLCPPSWLIKTAGVGMGVVYAVLAVIIAYLPWVLVDRQGGLGRGLTA
jgi:hypothetical protein